MDKLSQIYCKNCYCHTQPESPRPWRGIPLEEKPELLHQNLCPTPISCVSQGLCTRSEDIMMTYMKPSGMLCPAVQDPVCSIFFCETGPSNSWVGAQTCIGISFWVDYTMFSTRGGVIISSVGAYQPTEHRILTKMPVLSLLLAGVIAVSSRWWSQSTAAGLNFFFLWFISILDPRRAPWNPP